MTSRKKESEPPRLGRYLLKKIYDDEHYDEVSGDLREMFIDRLSRKGKLIASVQYLIDAILSARNFDLRRKQEPTSNNNIDMLKNYIKITIRTISKNKVYSALNIVGLALGIAACLFILQYVSYEQWFVKFCHKALIIKKISRDKFG